VLAICLLLLTVLWPTPARAAGGDVENRVLTADGEWAPVRDAMPGETLFCRSAVTLRRGGAYTLRGLLSPGLSFGAVTELRLDGETVNASYYTISTAYQEPGCAFTVHLAEGFAPDSGGELTLLYTLQLNDSAAGEAGDAASLTVTDARSRLQSGEAALIVSRGLTVYRGVLLPENNGASNPVFGACLSLYRDAARKDRVAFREREEDVYLACAGEACAHTRHAYVVRTPTNGRLRLEGLPAGTYYLAETRPPEGMTESAEPVEVTISTDGEILAGGVECPEGVVPLLHTPADVTEGRAPDPLAFYRIGSRVLALALSLLVAGRRYYFN